MPEASTIPAEIWRDIEGYEGKYKVSNMGRVMSVERRVRDGRIMRRVPQRILKQTTVDGNYAMISLYLYGRETKKNLAVHRLVAKAFLGEKPFNSADIRHLNGKRADCRAQNLAYGTRSDNMQDDKRRGVTFRRNAKLVEQDIPHVRAMLNTKMTQVEIGACFGVSRSAISHIKRGNTWQNIY